MQLSLLLWQGLSNTDQYATIENFAIGPSSRIRMIKTHFGDRSSCRPVHGLALQYSGVPAISAYYFDEVLQAKEHLYHGIWLF